MTIKKEIIIMRLKDIRANAREALKGNWFIAIIASFIAGTFGALGTGISSAGAEGVEDFSKLSELTTEEILVTVAVFGGITLLGLIISIAISALIVIGYAQFNLDLVDGYDPKISTIFSKGKQIRTTIAAYILVLLRVILGLILFIVPGIIAAYKYSMVHYIIAENPGITAREALERSKDIMDGNKFRFFRFGLTFIGWGLLEALTFGIASIWVTPYIQASYAAFYRDIA